MKLQKASVILRRQFAPDSLLCQFHRLRGGKLTQFGYCNLLRCFDFALSTQTQLFKIALRLALYSLAFTGGLLLSLSPDLTQFISQSFEPGIEFRHFSG